MGKSSLSIEQVLAFLAAARAGRERDWLAFAVGFNHGLRASEIIGLTRDNVRGDFLIVQRLKGSNKTRQPLIEHENPLLNEKRVLLAFAQKASGRLFEFSRQHLWRLFRKYAEDAGIPEHLRHPHILKHSLAMALIPQGLEITRQYLGHKAGSSTMEYLKTGDDEASAAAARALGARLS